MRPGPVPFELYTTKLLFSVTMLLTVVVLPRMYRLLAYRAPDIVRLLMLLTDAPEKLIGPPTAPLFERVLVTTDVAVADRMLDRLFPLISMAPPEVVSCGVTTLVVAVTVGEVVLELVPIMFRLLANSVPKNVAFEPLIFRILDRLLLLKSIVAPVVVICGVDTDVDATTLAADALVTLDSPLALKSMMVLADVI